MRIEKYLRFEGRATRAEYWVILLGTTVAVLGAGVFVPMFADIGKDLFGEAIGNWIAGLWFLFIGGFAVWLLAAVVTRRLHDFNFSGWYGFFSLAPVVGTLVVFVIGLRDPREPNRFGDDPRPARRRTEIA